MLVWLTDDGAAAFEDYKARAFAALRVYLDVDCRKLSWTRWRPPPTRWMS